MRYSIGVGSCKEFVRRNVRYLIELRVVRSLLVEWRGRLSCCEEMNYIR